MKCYTIAVLVLMAALLALVFQLIPVNLPRQTLNRTLPYAASFLPLGIPGRMRITLKLEFEISFPKNVAEHESEAHVVELDGTSQLPGQAEIGTDMPPMQNAAQGPPAAHAPLMGSLNGIPGLHVP